MMSTPGAAGGEEWGPGERFVTAEAAATLARAGELYALVDEEELLEGREILEDAAIEPYEPLDFVLASGRRVDPELPLTLCRVGEVELQLLCELGPDRPWGILGGAAPATPGEGLLAAHCAWLATVADSLGEAVHFRYYDDRILPRFLSGTSAEEQAVLFGPWAWLGAWQTDPPGIRVLEPRRRLEPAAVIAGEYRGAPFQLQQRHLEPFREDAERVLVTDLVQHLRTYHGEVVGEIEEEELRGMVEVGIRRARRHGFETQRDLGTFVGLMFEVAPNFDEQPRLRELLADPRLQGRTRWFKLLRQTNEADWEAAMEAFDVRAWFDPAMAEGTGEPAEERGDG